MSSQLKRNTARTNGAKSQGPATPEGRAKSARNSLRHGLSSKTVVLPHEDADQFHLLLDAHIDQFHPATTVEMELVEAMAVARWRLRRICAIETALLSTELERRRDDMDDQPAYKTDDDRLAYVFCEVADNSQSLPLLIRYEGALNRTYDRALKQLTMLQRARQNEPKPAPEPAVLPAQNLQHPVREHPIAHPPDLPVGEAAEGLIRDQVGPSRAPLGRRDRILAR